MKLIRLFLMSGFAVLAFSGVAAAAEGPSVPAALATPVAPALATPVSTTASPGGSLTTYSDGMELFTPASPDAISDCNEQWFCLWEKTTSVEGEPSGTIPALGRRCPAVSGHLPSTTIGATLLTSRGHLELDASPPAVQVTSGRIGTIRRLQRTWKAA